MDMNLSAIETRVIGCLIEKEKTTPDQYPLSLNGLTTACNQKSNRDPVMELPEREVQECVERLLQKGLLMRDSGYGSRVEKYKHRFCNTEFSELQLSKQEMAIVCVLFLRGAQTPGELRTRTNRLCQFTDVHEVDQVLHAMASNPNHPLVAKLPREPGKRENRYMHLFSGEVSGAESVSSAPVPELNQPSSLHTKIDLEQRVSVLEQQVATLQQQLDDLLN